LISTDGYKNEDIFFELFLKTLNNLQVKPAEIAGVIPESCQRVGQSPAGYRGGGDPGQVCRFTFLQGLVCTWDIKEAIRKHSQSPLGRKFAPGWLLKNLPEICCPAIDIRPISH